MMRLEDWSSRLSAEIERRSRMPFQTGTHCCLTFAAACVFAVTGERPFEALERQRGRFSTPLGAARKLRVEGFQTVEDLVDAYLPRITRLRAQRGDLISIMSENGPAVGVVLGEAFATAAEVGLSYHRVIDARRYAWRVG